MSSPPIPRSRGPRHAACERCRSRKQRCDTSRPSCSSCVKASQACEYPAEAADSSSYVRSLEERLRLLESRPIRSSRSPTARPIQQPSDVSHHNLPETPRSHGRVDPPQLPDQTFGEVLPVPTHTELSAFTLDPQTGQDLAESADSTTYIAPSSDQLITRLPIATALFPPEGERREDSVQWPRSVREYITSDITRLLAWRQRSLLLEQFLQYYNSAFRVFDEGSLRHTFQAFPTAACFNRYDAFLVYMVMAIALGSQNRGPNPDPRRRAEEMIFWQHARPHLQFAFGSPGISKAQARHLMLHYSLMRPETGSVWSVSGDTVRCVIDLGLHYERPARLAILTPHDVEMRRRVFWATFCVDTNLSTALGRPPAIAWDWVSAQIPPHNLEDPDSMTFRHMVDLRLLQAEINRVLYTETAIDKPVDLEWLESVQNRIELWHQDTLPPTHDVSLMNEDWHTVSYYLSIAFLNRPCPANARPTPICLQRARSSSRAIMQLFKSMHRKGRISLGWLAINHLFMSGVTFLHCLLLEPDQSQLPPLASVVMDIQACASTLEGLTSLHLSGHDIRDAFEQVSMSVITALSEPSATQATASPMDLSGNAIVGGGLMQDAWESLQTMLMIPSTTDNEVPGGIPWTFEEIFEET